ncbi:MAG: aminotransferase class V-fold PLP-dependent enzyme [Chloroflexi bacterium]|nr:aminotransferase class V-fold PLP-dependent enzyme [Chloroflexota bacterium]
MSHAVSGTELDLPVIRSYFPAIRQGRIVTNNAASTQMPDPLLNFCKELCLTYDNVHRGQSAASVRTTALFENAYRVIANFVGAASWRDIILYRGTTEAINAVMYSLMTEFRDGDNIVTTYMEHNSNYIPWYALCREILPRFGRKVQCRLARFDPETGELDIDNLAGLVDKRTKLVCCTGASNFLATRPPLDEVRQIADDSGYEQPNGVQRSYFLVDGAQLVPNSFVDVVRRDMDFLAWSFHKMLAPVGVGALYARESVIETMRPFHYGGDMIAEGEVSPERVGYNMMPWRFTAGTPNILGSIMAGKATEFLVRAALGFTDGSNGYLLARDDIRRAMGRIQDYEIKLNGYLLEKLAGIKNLTVYGPAAPERRTSLISFNIRGKDPFDVARALDRYGVEARAGCHCATLAHYYLGLDPPASCRISPYFYNTLDEMRFVVDALREIAAG